MPNTGTSTKKKKKNTKLKSRRRTKVFVGIAVFMGIAFIAAAAALNAPAVVAEMFRPPAVVASPALPPVEYVDTYTIADGVFIDGIDVSGLTKEAALRRLHVEVGDSESALEITLSHGDYIFTYTLADFNVQHDFGPAIDFAYSIGRERDATGTVELASDFTFDSEAVSNILTEIVNEIDKEAYDASMVRENGVFVITPETVGAKVNQHRLVEDLMDAINARQSADIEIEVVETVPELTEAIFARSTDRIGSFYTIISGNDPGRNQNLLNASLKIDNYMVMPGEIFSTNRAFGAMTYENGYRLAPVIVNGQLVPGMGGGICQVSTGLYIALLFAEVRIVERLNHSMRVAYVDYAWDATLATDLIDLRFENDTGYPLTIVAYIVGNRSYVHIYGHESRPAGRRLEFFSRVIERIPAPEATIVEVDSLAPGARQTISPAREGVVAELIKVVFDGNTELYRERANLSRYRARAAIIHVGAGEVPQAGPYAYAGEPDDDDYDDDDDPVVPGETGVTPGYTGPPVTEPADNNAGAPPSDVTQTTSYQPTIANDPPPVVAGTDNPNPPADPPPVIDN